MANGKMNDLGETRVKLSPLMLFVLLLVSGMGLAYLVPLNEAAKICGPSAYLAVLLAGILLLPFIFLVIGLQHRFPEKNILGAATETYGVLIGTLLNLIYLAALSIQVIDFVHNTAELLITYSLNRTPLWAITAMILISSGFIAKDGLVGVSRLAGFVFIPVFFFRIIILAFATQGMETSQLLPVITASPLEYIRGGLSMTMIFAPAGISLLFIYPLLSKPGKLKLITCGLIGAQTLITFISFCIVIGVFGSIGVQSYGWPVFEVIRRIDISFLALDQLGIIFLIVWLTALLIGLALGLYLFGSGINQHFKNLKYQWCLLGGIFIFGAGVLLIPNQFYDFYIFEIISKSFIGFFYAYPLLIYVGALFRGIGVKKT
jgi:spore germination protein